MLLRYVDDLEVYKVHDETLSPLIKAQLAEGVSATSPRIERDPAGRQLAAAGAHLAAGIIWC
jgi:hypothetical protein